MASVDDPESDPSELRLLEQEGYHGVVGAVAGTDEGVYLLELFSDGPGAPLQLVGAVLTLADVDQARAERLAAELGATVVAAEVILRADVDIVSPNALGAILTEQSIAALSAKIVAGGANNQLATAADGRRLHEAGVVYAPDYVINAGGIINVSVELLPGGYDEAYSLERIARIYDNLKRVFQIARDEKTSTREAADALCGGCSQSL